MAHTATGTDGYMAPEILNKLENEDNTTEYDRFACDLWSLCVTFLSLALQQNPSQKHFTNIAKGILKFPDLPEYS